MIDEALKILSTVAGQIASLIGQATSFADALNRVGSRVRQAVKTEDHPAAGYSWSAAAAGIIPAGSASQCERFILSGLAPLRYRS